MIKKIYIFGICILILSTLVFNAYFLNQSNVVNFEADSSSVTAKDRISGVTLSGKENIATGDMVTTTNYLGEKYTLADFEQAHSPLNEDAPSWANILLEGYSIKDALSYAKIVLSKNKNPYAVEALPVLMTAFKELNQTGQLESFLVTTIDNLAQDKNEESDQKIYDLSLNALRNVTRSEAYSVSERMSLYKSLQSDRMPDDIKRAAIDFQNELMRACKEYSCEESS